jgi:uncharacterized protein with PIN domain
LTGQASLGGPRWLGSRIPASLKATHRRKLNSREWVRGRQPSAMSRIRKVYEARFRALLQRVHARRLEPGVQWLLNRAVRLSQTEGISLTHALIRVHGLVAERLHQREGSPGPVRRGPILFLCDAGLGGLARWLRAAGQEAIWNPALDDDELLREAVCLRATVVTTDSLLMERRLVLNGSLSAFWVPPTLKVAEQLALVFSEFGLTVGEPRCMRCGGELRPVDKETMRERIPPKTWRWLDEYFVCSRCDQLFWKGTHWRRIGNQLSVLQAKA